MTPKLIRAVAAVCLLIALKLHAQVPDANHKVINLPTSKQLTVPSPGRLGSTNGFAATMVLSPDGHYAAILHDGFGTQETMAHQSISILNLDTNQIADFPDSRLDDMAHQSYFIGLAFSSDGKQLYASIGSLSDATGARPGDMGNGIAVYSFAAGKVAPERFIPIPLQPLPIGKKLAMGLKAPPHMAIPYPAGIAVIADGGHDKLLIANNLSDNVILIDSSTGKTLQTFDLSTNDLVPAAYPYTCVATRDGRRAWCSLWNASQVAELDLTSGKLARWIGPSGAPPIAPTLHPTAMILTADEKTLFVSESNDDMILVIDAASGVLKGMLGTNLKGVGSQPVSLALSAIGPSGPYLFAGLASLDAVGVFDAARAASVSVEDFSGPELHSQQPLGFIPTDWYPTALAVHGDDLIIATSKGEGTRSNKDMGKTVYETKHKEHAYIPTLLRGSVARLNIPKTIEKLPEYTEMVTRDNLFHRDPGTITFAGGQNPIKHVIYVMKENRTFDQILGDLKVGDADPSLNMYGEDITPNEHKLALQFGVLDNFYDSGEVSGDGHVWSTAAITSDYNEKTWQIVYRGKERSYDFEGFVGDIVPMDLGIPDIDDPATGYLWGNLARHNLTYRNYGEFVETHWCLDLPKNGPKSSGAPTGHPPDCTRKQVKPGEDLPANLGGGKSPYKYAIPLMAYDAATKPELRGHFDPNYADFKVEYPEQFRADEFLREFAGFVQARQSGTGEQLPQFVLLRLPNDHTAGTRPGSPTPNASVADNDLALGRVVEAVSHSPYWDDTAIFVLEDDAQSGADHVDAHRSIALVISKYAPGTSQQPAVDHHFYTTVNMVHTMETVLGLPPMNNNDAPAAVMATAFSGAGNQLPFKADYRNRDNGMIYQANAANAPGAKQSAKLNFSVADAADANVLNAILWRAAKGNTPMPAPKHNVLPANLANHGDVRGGDDAP